MNRRLARESSRHNGLTSRLTATSSPTSHRVGRMESKSAIAAHSTLPDYYSSMCFSYKATSSQIDESAKDLQRHRGQRINGLGIESMRGRSAECREVPEFPYTSPARARANDFGYPGGGLLPTLAGPPQRMTLGSRR